MSRKKKHFNIREILPDYKYNNIYVSRFINLLMKDGKKTIAETILYKALALIKCYYKLDPLKVFLRAIALASPMVEIKNKKVGGALYKIPIKLTKKKGIYFSMVWIKKNAKKRKQYPYFVALFKEIIETYNNNSTTISIKNNIHKIAELNRAFSHFAF